MGLSARCKDVQNHLGPVQHLGVGSKFQSANLRRGMCVVEDHYIGLALRDQIAKLFDLTMPQIGTSIGSLALLRERIYDDGSSGCSQSVELTEWVAWVA